MNENSPFLHIHPKKQELLLPVLFYVPVLSNLFWLCTLWDNP